MKIGIIGSGTMGSGIAQVAATAGCWVLVYDADADALERSRTKLDKILSRLIEKGRIDSEEKASIQGKISYVTALSELASASLVIEAIVENLAVKQRVLREVEGYLEDETIIATNTSSLSVTAIAAALRRPENFVGIHFFNPAPLMNLVEVVPAVQTDWEILTMAEETIAEWGKTVVTAKDTPGFIVNRVARPFYGEALRIYEEGVADFATIDYAMKTHGGFRMGPFQLMDLIGNDVNYAVTETVFANFYYDPRYKPSFTQKRLVEAGYLGRKSGRGFYNYSEGVVPPSPNRDQVLTTTVFERILVMLINEAADALFLNVASAAAIDDAMTQGVNYPRGLLRWADERGIAWCVEGMDALYHRYHEDRYRCSPLLRTMLRDGKRFFT